MILGAGIAVLQKGLTLTRPKYEIHAQHRADEASHEDPAIASFLALLEKDIRTGQHLCNLPDGLVQAMQAATTLPVDLDADIEGDVAL